MTALCCLMFWAVASGCQTGGETGAANAVQPETQAAAAPAPEKISPEVFDPDKYPEVDRALRHLAMYEDLLASLRDALGNWTELALALVKDVPPEEKENAAWLVCNLAHLDRIEVTASILGEHVTCAAATKSWYPKSVATPGDYREYVLYPRITMFDHVTAWRKELQERFRSFVTDDFASTARKVNEWVAANFKVIEKEDCYFGPQQDPRTLLRVLRGTEFDACLLTCGIMRAVGVPARVDPAGRWVQFHDGERWQPVYPMSPAEFAVVRTDPEVERSFKDPARIRLSLLKRGLPVKNTESFSLSVWKDGSWMALDERNSSVTEEIKDDHILLTLPEGKYLAMAGSRNRNGDVMVQTREVEVKSGEETQLEFKLDIPLSELATEELVVRKLEKLPELALTGWDPDPARRNQKSSLAALAAEKNVVLSFFTLDNEPCKRMIPAIAGSVSDDGAGHTATALVYLGDPDGAELADFVKENAATAPFVMTASGSDAKEFFKLPYSEDAKRFTSLPSTMMIRKGGQTVFWAEGYDLNIVGSLEEALRLAGGE